MALRTVDMTKAMGLQEMYPKMNGKSLIFTPQTHPIRCVSLLFSYGTGRSRRTV